MENKTLDEKQLEALRKLRKPFDPLHISKLPKPTASQTAEVKKDFKKGVRCADCGGWHHPKVIHLDYVGHAALTNRLLDVDPLWTWEPFATSDDGLPLLDKFGGLWIRLTVCGMTRIGYGDAEGKTIGTTAMKEIIGDALRNGGMRFGMALELWCKGDLRQYSEDDTDENDQWYIVEIDQLSDRSEMSNWWSANSKKILKETKEEQDKIKQYFMQIKALLPTVVK